MGWLRPDLGALLPAEPLPIAAISDLVEALRQTSAADGWRDECFTLCNEAGEPIVDLQHQAVGLERSLFRPLGLFYTTVQLNLVTEQGRAWIGQRALHKAVDPGLWDAAVAGGLTHGEQPQQALRRECWEEAGLSDALLPGLRVLGSVLVQRALGSDGRQGLQREQVMSYGLQAPLDFTPTNQDGEVQAFACVPLDEIWRSQAEHAARVHVTAVVVGDGKKVGGGQPQVGIGCVRLGQVHQAGGHGGGLLAPEIGLVDPGPQR
jgi:8-oxo-dGTP pyrophosphatase MutT (NUDIX family)